MANWNTTFSQRLSFDLENGLLGSPSDFANTITRYYTDTLLTGQASGIPASLPAPAQSGAPAAVGPTAVINGYDGRARIFNQTLRVYFEAKAIAQGKANIQDIAQSINRLVIKSKRLQRDLSSSYKQSRLIAEEIKRLPETLKEAVTLLLEYIKEELDTIKSLPSTLEGFRLQFGEVQFKNIFQLELDVITKITNFKPTTRLRDYRDLFILLSDFGTRISTLQRNFGNSNNIKIYIYRKLQAAISNILFVVEGISNPAAIIDFVRNLSYKRVKYRRLYRLLFYFVKRSAFLTVQRAKVKTQIKKYKLELDATIKPKLASLRQSLQARVQENANKLLKFKQSKIILNAVKSAKQYGEIINKNYAKLSKQIKKYVKVTKLTSLILAKIDAISEAVIVEISRIITEAQNLVSNTTNAIQATSEELKTYIKGVLGITNDFIVASIATAGVRLYLSKNDIKVLFTRGSRKLTNIVDAINTLFSVDIPALRKAIYDLKSQDTKPKIKTPKKVDLFTLNDQLANLKLALKEVEALTKRKIKELTDYGKRQLQSAKDSATQYVNNIVALNAFLNKTNNKKLKIESETKERKKQAYDAKRLAALVVTGSKIIGLSASVLRNVGRGNILISQNENDLTGLINQYYRYIVVSNGIDQKAASLESNRRKKQLKDIIYSELLITLLRSLIAELRSGNFMTELKDSISQTKTTITDRFTESFTAFETLITKSTSVSSIIRSVENLNLAILVDNTLIQNLYRLEQKYLRKFKQTVKVARKGSLTSKNKLLQEFYTGVEKTNSIILLLLELIKKAVDQTKNFVYGLVRPIKQKISKSLEDRKRRQREKVEALLNQKVEKALNTDALGMSTTFEIATRLFWTGFSWTNPVGTTFVVTNIGPFKPIKALGVNGSQGYAEELSSGFEGQLKLLTGTAIPNPATGIPPFPFIGYN